MSSSEPNIIQFCDECRSGANTARHVGLPAQYAGELDQSVTRHLDRADAAALYEPLNASPSPSCLRCGAHLAQQLTNEQEPSIVPQPRTDVSHRLPRLDVLDPDFLATVDQQTLLGALLETALNQSPANTANVQLVAPDQDGLYIAAQQGFDRPFLDFFGRVSDDGSACAIAATKGTTVMIPNVVRSLLYTDASRQAMLDARSHAVQSFPLISSTGQLLGVFSCHYHKVGRPSDDVAPLLSALARAATRSLQRQAQNGNGPPVTQAGRRANDRQPSDTSGQSSQATSAIRKIVTGISRLM